MYLNAYNNFVMVSPADDQESILELFKDIYSKDPAAGFTLLNLYKELPISSSSKIFEIKGSTVEFLSNATQVCIMGETQEVVIQSKLMNTNIVAKVMALDIRRMQVTLGGFSYAELHSDKRSSVRVRLKLPMQLQMVADGNNLSGVIHDISLGGVCVRTFAGSLLERAKAIELKIKLLHGGTNQVLEALIPSRVVRIDKKDIQTSCAMVFDHTPQSEQVLSTFIYQRQLEIIKELKSKL
jgi:c-di-GMP-binding flagellar brake protein YcgR